MKTPATPRGFTVLEILLAMAIFSMLGLFVVYLMRQGMNVFVTGTRDSAVQDRADTVLPRVRRDLVALYTGDRFDPPPLPPDPARLLESRKEAPPPPPVEVRLRAGTVAMRDAPEGPLKEVPSPFFAFVVATQDEWRDPVKRRDPVPGVEAKDYVPAEVNQLQGTETAFKPTAGLLEVLWIAVAEDPAQPGVLTLRRGYRAPVGGPESLLDPANFDTLDEVRKRCPVVERGVLHFSATWRNAFATTWEPVAGGGVSDTDPYVGTVWDSTRGLEKAFRLHRGPESLADPSDDRFPAAVRLEIALAATTQRGFAPETQLREGIDDTTATFGVADVNPLFARTGAFEGADRWLKVDTEWMSYRLGADNPNATSGEVSVRRGQRGTKALAHAEGSRLYVGTSYRSDVRLRMSRDAFARRPR